MAKCIGKTSDGTRCKHVATAGKKVCWQHEKGVRRFVSRSKCRSGYRKNSSGRCVRKRGGSRKKCSPGYRKSSSGRCVRKSYRKRSYRKTKSKSKRKSKSKSRKRCPNGYKRYRGKCIRKEYVEGRARKRSNRK